MTVTEAAAKGTPSVCFDVPGLRDSVTPNTGYIFKTEEELFRKWENLINDQKTLQAKSKNCLKHASRYLWESQLAELSKVVSSLFE